MLFLILAVLSSAMISIIMRLSSDKVNGNFSMLAFNYLTCAFLGAGYAGFRIVPTEVPGFAVTLSLGFLSGILFLGGFILFQVSTKKNGVVLSSIFMKLGLLVPIVVSVFLFNEMPSKLQGIGFLIAVVAIILINYQKGAETARFDVRLILLLLIGGSADAMAKIFEEYGPAELSDQFLFYTFSVALLLCIGVVIWKKEKIGKKEFLYGIVIGIPNFFSSKFLIGALEDLPAVVVYPTYSVATIMMIAITGVFAFREQLSKKQWIALIAIIVALFLLNT